MPIDHFKLFEGVIGTIAFDIASLNTPRPFGNWILSHAGKRNLKIQAPKMIDTFKSLSEGLGSPPSSAIAVVPSDTENLDFASRCINAATSGSLRVTTLKGDNVTLHIGAGVVFPVRVSRIWATGTTATGLVVMY